MPRITRPLPDGPARKRPPAALRWGVVLLVAAALGAVAGVNLDEEAADLLRYQQAYQAAAQMIATADTVFQTLLNAVR